VKEKELRERATCSKCNQKIGHTHVPLFWTVKATRWGLDGGAIQRASGLAMMMGSPALAMAMGTDEDLAVEVEAVDVTLCEECAIDLMALLESCKRHEAEGGKG
jgi:hypothetical protein